MHLRENDDKYYVYALVDPINRTPFYIGKGIGNRATHHLQPNHKHNKRKLSYIQAIRMLGMEPQIKYIAEGLFEKDAYAIEFQCIEIAKNIGIPLTNGVGIDPPNRTGKLMPDSAKKKISDFQRGKSKGPMSIKTKMILSMKGKGKPSYSSTNVTCPNCKIVGSNRAMYRWHFSNCKSLKV
jgi:hypothetical protein